MIAMGFIKTWDAMAGMRVLLGILEVGSSYGRNKDDALTCY